MPARELSGHQLPGARRAGCPTPVQGEGGFASRVSGLSGLSGVLGLDELVTRHLSKEKEEYRVAVFRGRVGVGVGGDALCSHALG